MPPFFKVEKVLSWKWVFRPLFSWKRGFAVCLFGFNGRHPAVDVSLAARTFWNRRAQEEGKRYFRWSVVFLCACCFSVLVSQLISSGFLFFFFSGCCWWCARSGLVRPKRSGDSPVERVQFFGNFFLFGILICLSWIFLKVDFCVLLFAQRINLEKMATLYVWTGCLRPVWPIVLSVCRMFLWESNVVLWYVQVARVLTLKISRAEFNWLA